MSRRPLLDRLRRWAPHTVTSVPDDDGTVGAALTRLQELLSALRWAEHDLGPDGWTLPEPLANGVALAAADRVAEAVADVAGHSALPLSPGGARLVPLSFARLEVAELHLVGAAIRALGAALLPGANPQLLEAIEHHAAGAADPAGISLPGRAPTDVEDLVVEAASVHGLLDLPWDHTVARLADVLGPAAANRTVTLTPDLHADYQVVAERIVGIWHHGDARARARYQGS